MVFKTVGIEVQHMATINTKYEVSFFFTRPGNEGIKGVFQTNILICTGYCWERNIPTADQLRSIVHPLIVNNKTFFKLAESHTVTADIGVSKESGGHGVRRPIDTIIIFKPP